MTWRPFWIHFGPFLIIWDQTNYLRLEHCDVRFGRLATPDLTSPVAAIQLAAGVFLFVLFLFVLLEKGQRSYVIQSETRKQNLSNTYVFLTGTACLQALCC